MNGKNRLFLSIISILFFGQTIFAQHQEITFKHLSTVDGLSNFTVLSIVQDKRGFMWFGTMDGLNRFDGNSIRTYRYDRDDPFSLGNNLVHSLLCTSDSGLWIGTSRGLYYYNYYHDNFHAIEIIDRTDKIKKDLEIKAMIKDHESIWIGTSQGLFKYDLLSNTSIPFISGIEDNIVSETVEAIHKSSDGSIWIGGKQGLMVYKGGEMERIDEDINQKYNHNTNVISINSDKDGNIWFGTLDRETGLIVYNPNDKSFSDLNARDGFLPHNKVNCLYRFENGKIWAGTTWGLSIIDQSDFTTQILHYERQNPGGISHNSIRHIYHGDDGIIWIGTYSGGINYFDNKSQLIQHKTNIYKDKYSLSFNIVSSIYEDREKNLWIGTEYGGLNILNSEDQSFTVLRTDNSRNSLKSNNIKSTIEDEKGRMFIATQFGMSIYDPKSQSFFNIDDQGGSRGRLNFYGVKDFCKDDLGNIWIGTHKWIGTSKIPGPGYLLMYDVIKDSVIHFLPESEELAIIGGGVNSLTYDRESGMVWCGGDNGLNSFDTKEKKYLTSDEFLNSAKKLDGTVINDLFLDRNGLLWIATFGQGLQIMDVSSFQLRRISIREGITEKSIYAIVGDENGDIWTSGSAYLLKMNALIGIQDSVVKVERYGIQEGFPPQQFYRAAACKGSDGTLYFGGDDGYIAFDPNEISNNVFHPSVTILDVLINGRSLELKSETDMEFLNVASLENLSLTYDQSSFALQFIAPNYINQKNTFYQYQLSGIHESWQDLGTSNSINFTELKPGDYELMLRASSDPKNFDEDYTSLNIHVESPYWGTPLAYFIYLLMILSLLYLFFIITRKWERLNQNFRFEHLQREQEEAFNQQRLKFFTDISHELRTPLTLILAPLERIIQSNFGNAKIKNQLMLMLRNGDRMLQLINQLLDLRKLETGHIQLQAAKGNIVRFVQEVSLSFRELAQNRSIEFSVDCAKSKINAWFDRDKFEIILFNVLSNAVKFTPNHGKIKVFVGEIKGELEPGEEEQIIISIENTGKGISGDQIDHIFERFYSGQNDNHPNQAGSGVGLEIVKNLVDLHKGSIIAKSTYDKNGLAGTTNFTISIKKGKKHLAKNDLVKNYKSSEDIKNYGLPLGMVEIREEPLEKEEQVASTSEESTILVVEDNNEVRQLVISIFNSGYRVLQANDGMKGLDIAKNEIPDLIISDIMMPGIDGIELCRKIKSDVNTSHIPVILLTARTAVTFRYEGLETGADDYIVKPFNVEALRLRAINLIKQRKLLKDRFSKSGLVLPNEISLTSVDEKLLQNTIDYIIEHIDQKELTVESIARNVGMSRTNFYRKVKALTGLSASEFLRKIRMDRAAQLLKTNKIRISEVRFMVGISDADYFRDCFKKQFGLTPKAYIESE